MGTTQEDRTVAEDLKTVATTTVVLGETPGFWNLIRMGLKLTPELRRGREGGLQIRSHPPMDILEGILGIVVILREWETFMAPVPVIIGQAAKDNIKKCCYRKDIEYLLTKLCTLRDYLCSFLTTFLREKRFEVIRSIPAQGVTCLK